MAEGAKMRIDNEQQAHLGIHENEYGDKQKQMSSRIQIGGLINLALWVSASVLACCKSTRGRL